MSATTDRDDDARWDYRYELAEERREQQLRADFARRARDEYRETGTVLVWDDGDVDDEEGDA